MLPSACMVSYLQVLVGNAHNIYVMAKISELPPEKQKLTRKSAIPQYDFHLRSDFLYILGFFPNISQYSILEEPNLVLFHHIIYYQTPQNDKHSDTRHGD